MNPPVEFASRVGLTLSRVFDVLSPVRCLTHLFLSSQHFVPETITQPQRRVFIAHNMQGCLSSGF